DRGPGRVRPGSRGMRGDPAAGAGGRVEREGVMSRPETKASSYGTEHDGPVHEGGLSGNGRRVAIVAARFNDFIVEKLIDGARAALRRAGAAHDDIELYRCPGAMEIPGLARKVADTGKFDGLVCLGAVIRGATPHFDLVVREAAAGVG